ncbi:unnamed protein product [Medioppia subpectinata]|uniref:Uncharacterized protein n=1 Tax=Medioppia subpectinata TaxID=1979941 RepID=A0A7R9LHU2_9ACAR|nr:unnamed protein product [Medioppia subpectinata]CAG2118975.1 unnamed protein product [Medioppia subpectinata]
MAYERCGCYTRIKRRANRARAVYIHWSGVGHYLPRWILCQHTYRR